MYRPLSLPGLLIATPARYADHRGYFSEVFQGAAASEAGLPPFVQDNESLSVRRGTIRGLHFQRPPFAQAKLVRCVRGAILDIVVDLRRGSPAYGQHSSVQITADGREQLYVPVGFAHGFCTLEDDTLVQYKASALYAPAHDGGLAWNDPDLGIDWPVPPGEAILSNKDGRLPRFADLPAIFSFE